MLTEFEYVAWFQDPYVEPEAEDFEWPAVFVILASARNEAIAWGDVLARSYAGRSRQRFLRSTIRDDLTPDARLPRVTNGVWASASHIGW